MEPSEKIESDEVFRFTARYFEDELAGSKRTLDEYLELFPAFPDLIRRTFTELEDHEQSVFSPPTGGPIDHDDTVGPYRILSELGRGGQGVVYLAEDARLHRRVALKVLRPFVAESASMRARLAREAEAASKLDHPGICTVYEVGEADGRPYIAMRFVEGRPLSGIIADARSAEGRGGKRSLVELVETPADATEETDSSSSTSGSGSRDDLFKIVRFVERTARALHAAHEVGLIHRDIKPGNIMVSADGDPVLLDFGLARDEDAVGQTLTQSGEMLGTPAYMSPEQISTRAVLDRRTDVYSLGVTLFESLTLRRPFDAQTREQLYRDILTTDVPSPRRLNPRISKDLGIVLAVAMERDRNRRYQTALDLADDLARLRRFEPIHARPIPRLLRLKRWAQRNPAAATALALVSIGLVVTAVLLGKVSDALDQVTVEKAKSQLMGLVSASEDALDADPLLGLSLARHAVHLEQTPETVSQLHRVLSEPLPAAILASDERHGWASARFADTNGRIAAVPWKDGLQNRLLRVWEPTGREVVTIETTAGIEQFEISPDGNRISLLMSDGSARFYDDQGALLKTVTDVAQLIRFPEDPAAGTLLFRSDGTVSHRDWEGVETKELSPTSGAVTAVRVGPTGDWLLLGCRDGVVERRNGRGEDAVLYAVGRELDLNQVGYCPSTGVVVAGSWVTRERIGHVLLWSAPEGRPRVVASGMGSFELAPGGRHLLTYDRPDVITLHDVPSLDDAETRQAWRVDRPKGYGALRGLHLWARFSVDGHQFFTLYQDGTIALWRSPSGSGGDRELHIQSITGRAFDDIKSCEYTKDGKYLLIAGNARAPRLFDLEGREVASFGAGVHNVGVVLSPDQKRFLTLSSPPRLWDLTNRTLPRYVGHLGTVAHVAVALDGRVATGTEIEGCCRLWSSSGELERELRRGPGFSLASVSVDFSPDDRYVLVGTMYEQDRVARVWDTQSGDVRELTGHDSQTRDVAFSSTGEMFTACTDGRGRRFGRDGKWINDYDAGARPEVPGDIRAFVFGIEVLDDRVLTTHGDGGCRLWELGGKLIETYMPRDQKPGRAQGAGFARFLPGGKAFVASYADGRLRFWSIGDPTRPTNTVIAASGMTVRVSPRGDRIAVGERDGTARILDLEGRQVAELRGHSGPVNAVRFTRDGLKLLTGSGDRSVRTWFVYTEDLINYADERLIRPLTDDERLRYEALLGETPEGR